MENNNKMALVSHWMSENQPCLWTTAKGPAMETGESWFLTTVQVQGCLSSAGLMPTMSYGIETGNALCHMWSIPKATSWTREPSTWLPAITSTFQLETVEEEHMMGLVSLIETPCKDSACLWLTKISHLARTNVEEAPFAVFIHNLFKNGGTLLT